MVNILIIGPQYRPIPSIEGGAIEHLIEQYVSHNENSKKFNLVVYSPVSNNTIINSFKCSNVEFRYIDKSKYSRNLSNYVLKLKRLVFGSNKYNSIYSKSVINDLIKRDELNKYDLVIVENQLESIIYYRKYLKCRFVEHLHNDYLNINTYNAKKILDCCDEVWCVSNFIKNQINKIDNGTKAITLYNGVDISLLGKKITDSAKSRIKKEFGININDLVFLYSGRIFKEKGVLELIKAFTNFSNNIGNVKLLIVGAPKERNSNYYQECLDVANEKVLFVGNLDYSKMNEIYNISDIQIIPSLWNEAFGLIAIEGLINHNALIITNSGALPEIVGGNAIIVDRNNIINDLEKSFYLLYNDESKRKSLTRNCLKNSKKFSIDNYYNRFDELITSIIKKR